jgi:hypothetical protein
VLAGFGALTDNRNDSYAAYGMALVSGKESTVRIPVPRGHTLTDLHVRMATAPGSGASWTFTTDKNGVRTALSCSIARAATSCSDASMVSIVAGDTIDLDITPFGSPALANVSWSVRPER